MKLYLPTIILFSILTLATFFRSYNINWDTNSHLHPDERAIVMFTLPLSAPTTSEEFFSPESPWNPHFFAYGSLPMYTLKIISELLSHFLPEANRYDGLAIVGRFLSIIFDIATLVCIYFLAKKLFSKTVGLLSSFLYAIAVLPIQLSHFYAVDTSLTFFTTLILYLLIRFYEKPTVKKSLLIGIFFGCALATKISATVILVAIGSDFLTVGFS